MRGAWPLALKELRDIRRERTIVLALMTQLFVAAFSSFLAVGLVGLYDPETVQGFPDTEIGYVGPGGFDAHLDDARNLIVIRLDADTARERFRTGGLAAVAEETFAEADDAHTLTLLLPESELRTTVLVTQLKGVLRDYERQLRLERQDRLEQQVVYVDTEADPDVFFTFAYSVLIPLLVVTPIFLSGAVAGDSVATEANDHTLRLLRASPMSASGIVIGKLAAPVLLAPAQVLLWLLLLALNGIGTENVLGLVTLTAAGALLLSSTSAIIAIRVQREGQTQAAYTVLILVVGLSTLLLPMDPLNLIARLAVGNVGALGYATLGGLVLLSLAALVAAIAVARDRMRADAVG